MKIPFTLEAWLKDKSQKVETRDGRIVHNIWRVKEPTYINNRKAEVCALIDGEEDALVFFDGGRYLPTKRDIDNPFDLFIVTPEPELSEFESAIKDLVLAIDEGELQELGVFEEENLGAWAVKKAAELLALAEKEIVNRVAKECYKEDFCIEDTVKFNEGYKLGKEVALKEFEEKYKQSWFNEGKIAGRFEGLTEDEKYQQGVHDGKEEALKDLLRWKKTEKDMKVINKCIVDWNGEIIASNFIPKNTYYIPISELEKLPKNDKGHE